MPSRVSVVFCVRVPSTDQPAITHALTSIARLFASRKWEATFVLDHARPNTSSSEDREIASLLRSQNVGMSVGEGPNSPLACTWEADFTDARQQCRKAYHSDFVAVSRFAASLPTAVSMRGWSPSIVPLVSDWGPHVVLAPTTFVDDDGLPFHWGTRLHLTESNAEWIDLAIDREANLFAESIASRVERSLSQGGLRPVLVHIPLDSWGTTPALAEGSLASLPRVLDQLSAMPHVIVQSARQLADRYDDISYEHSVPAEFFRSIVPHIAEGTLRPFEYALGFVSPAEQLYGFARLWLTTIEKGRAARNSILRGAIGPDAFVKTDTHVQAITADELKGLLSFVTRQMEDTGQVPSSIALRQGALAPSDLLATLAACYLEEVVERDLPIHRAVLPTERICTRMISKTMSDAKLPSEADVSRAVDAARCQLWTYKPAKLLD